MTIADLTVSTTTFARLHTDSLAALDTAAGGLAAAAGMAGDDPVLAQWRDLYDPIAALTWSVTSTVTTTLLDIAARFADTGNNYLAADHASGGDSTTPIPEPPPPGTAAAAPPSSTGPTGPGIPAELAAYWPGGDPGLLRSAGTTWFSLADTLDRIATAADSAFRSLTGTNSGDTFSAMETYWARHFQDCGSDPLFNAGPTTARALAHACIRLADVIDTTRAEVGHAAAAASEALSHVELPAHVVSRFTRGAGEAILTAGKAALTTKFLNAFRDYYLIDLDRLLGELRRIDQAHLAQLVTPPTPTRATEVALTDVGDVVGLGLSGSMWDTASSPDDATAVPTPDQIRLREDRRDHILDGDATGGGHRPGLGVPGKTEFPGFWDEPRILRAVATTARGPETVDFDEETGRWVAERRVDGILVRVVVDPDGSIRTAHPVDGPGVVRNPGQAGEDR